MCPHCWPRLSGLRRAIGDAMLSTMMNTPLGVATLHRFGARHFASSRVGDYDGSRIQWRRYDEIDADSARLAQWLVEAGTLRG